MTRNFFPTITIAIAALLAPMASHAWADDAPTREQLDAAKKAYGEGKALHDAGKLPEAIEKFKESYRLSRNAVLLYNIGLTLDENKQTDNALFYYRKFLSDAPADAAQRRAATDRVKQLEQEKLESDLSGKPADTGKPSDTTNVTTKTTTKPEAKIKPAGTYQPTEFQHQVVDDAPPGKALDISAFVPEDSGWTVTLYYRAAGDAQFVAKPMAWHYHQLIARVPAAKVSGSSIQYYIEVKDQAGTVITRSGKSTSPNLINLDATAQQHYFPDFTDNTEGKPEGKSQGATHHDDEDPLNKNKHSEEPVEAPQPVGPAGEGLSDVGSNKFEKAKWGTTIGAVAFVGIGVAFAVMAGNQASALADDAKMPHGTCTALPCPFDAYDKELQSAGQRDQTISNVAITVGVIGAVAAGYFWYRELTHKKHGETTAKATAASPEMTWMVAPSFGDHFSGAAAAVRF